MERKLAAIFSADVKGYSRLMGEDELATVRTLTAYREVMTTLIQAHRGRVVDSPGDNILAEFASVVDAVQCATEVQKELKAKNAALPEQRQMQFRIGINVGDVLTEGGRLYGDGVNIAARLEGLAEAGGICISEAAYTQVKNKLALGYEYIGEQPVKNIADPVRAYKIRLHSGTAALEANQQTQAARPPAQPDRGVTVPRPRLKSTLVLSGLLLAAVVVITLRHLSLRQPQPSAALPAAQPLPLPDKPSIVVLPFVNLSNDPTQEYFSDGITEDITTDLSKAANLFVIARNSAFTYKGRAVKVAEVSRELGVQYVLEGSIQRAGKQVRINAQLVDGATGYHIWAERYDRPLTDIFALQGEIAQKIVLALQVKVTPEEQARFRQAPTENLDAYDAFLRGMDHYWRFTKEDNLRARQLFEGATAKDPHYAAAYAMLGQTYGMDAFFQWTPDPHSLEWALQFGQRAAGLDESLPLAHSALSTVYMLRGEHQQARTAAEQALALAPNDADAYVNLGHILNISGKPEEGLEVINRGMRLNPHSPPEYVLALGYTYCSLGRGAEAVAAHKKVLLRNPENLAAHICLAACAGNAGWEAEALAAAAAVRRLSPQFSLEAHREIILRARKDHAVVEHMMNGLRKAGLK
jgi:adenylate cyclase